MNEELYIKIEHEDGRIEFIPKAEDDFDWVLKTYDKYYFVGPAGGSDYQICRKDDQDSKLLAHHNVFKTHEQAQKASKLMRRSNAIIRACLLVDPYFEPNWEDRHQEKWSVGYDNRFGKWWKFLFTFMDARCAYVSTEEKAQQVCSLLTKWGVN